MSAYDKRTTRTCIELRRKSMSYEKLKKLSEKSMRNESQFFKKGAEYGKK